MQNRTFYYSTEAGGYVERIRATDTMPEHEQVHDMLKRNAYAYYAYKSRDDIWQVVHNIHYSICDCFGEDGVIKRHPKHDGKDTSRDMVIPAIACMVKAEETHVANVLIRRIKFRISKRYFCTPSLWFWLKFIQHNKALYKWLFLLLFYIETLPAIAYTLLILKLYGVKATHHDELKYQTVIEQHMSSMPWLKRTLLRTTYPPFALFLAAQMFWALDIKCPIMAAYTRKVDISNYVCRKMFGEDVKHHSPPPPLNDIRWECEYSEREPRYFYRVEPENNLAIDFYNRLFS